MSKVTMQHLKMHPAISIHNIMKHVIIIYGDRCMVL